MDNNLQPHHKNGNARDAKTTTDVGLMDRTYIISSEKSSNDIDTSVLKQPHEETTTILRTTYLPDEQTDSEENDYYKWEKGLAIIFNNEEFKDSNKYKKREGTNCDERTLTLALEMFNFTVEVVKNGTVDKIMETLYEISDKKNYDCILVAVLSHGTYGDKLIAKDGEYKKEKLWEMLNGERCPHLIGKPKIVIIQACRGTRPSEPSNRIQTDGAPRQNEISFPVEADIVTAYSTYEGRASFRDMEKGTWYIQSLSSEITKHGATHDFITLLTRVNNKVARQEYIDEYEDIKKQMPVIQSTLTKMLYLAGTKPGLEEKSLASLLQANSDKLDILLSRSSPPQSSPSSTTTLTKPGARWDCLKVSPAVTVNYSLPTSVSILKNAKLLQAFLQDKTIVPSLKSEVQIYGSLLVRHIYYWEYMEKSERSATCDLLTKFINTHAKKWPQYKSFDISTTDSKRISGFVPKRLS